jgi:hypothetical protein
MLRASNDHNYSNHKAVSLLVVSVVYYILTGSKNSCELAANDTTFLNFVTTVLSQTNSSSSIIILSLFYMKKLSTRVCLTGACGSEYRIWLTSLILADVCLNDNAFLMESWSKVSNLGATEIVAMRREFLTGLRFDLIPAESDYISWLESVEEHAASCYSFFMPFLTGTTYAINASVPLSPPLTPMFYAVKDDRLMGQRLL